MERAVYTVEPGRAERLDTFISSKSGMSRSHVRRLIKQGLVSLNALSPKAGSRVKEGDRIALIIQDEPEGILIPEDIPLEVIHEDDQIIVINKPPHMVIYPAAGNKSGTLMNALASRCRRLSSIGAPLRPGVVHRLDKETSGVIVIAKDDAAYYNLVRQFKEKSIDKHYLALVYGNLKTESGQIDAAIGRSVSDRKKMSTKTRRGKEAITRFEVIKRFHSATMAKVTILTGRTHQIRVHFASIGHPVLGDKTYGRKAFLREGEKKISFSRQMLHAFSLKLRHPATQEVMEFSAPVPEDMKMAIEELGGCV